MRDILIRWIGKYEGQIDAYQHILDAVERNEFDKDQILGLCKSMIEQIAPNIERDTKSLNELNGVQV